MKLPGTIAALLLLACTVLAAQESVAVFPPHAGQQVGEFFTKTAMATFEECLSAPNSGYRLHGREATDAAVKAAMVEHGQQQNVLYNDRIAVEIGGRLGVQTVCVSEIVKDDQTATFLINCKMIDVKTGDARSAKEICWSGGIGPMVEACEKLMGRLIGGRNAGSAAKPDEAPKGDLYVIIRDKNGMLHYLINGEKQTKAFDVNADVGKSIYESGGDVYTSKGTKIFKNGQKVCDVIIYNNPWQYKIHAILASGEDVYAVGSFCYMYVDYLGFVWKNGQIFQQYSSYSTCNSISISNDDVYVGGKLNKIPVIWKNGLLFHSFDEKEYECLNDRESGIISVFIR